MNDAIYHNFLIENPIIIKMLLKDNTTNKNIIFATDSYASNGYNFKDEINEYVFINGLFVPRSRKLKCDQINRSKNLGEIFTPAWMCNKQIDLIDDDWFKNIGGSLSKDNFTIYSFFDKYRFNKNIKWKNYVKSTRLEITCGEAPYIVSRYDVTNGDFIFIDNRFGILDRKFLVINEFAKNKTEWIEQSIIALKSVYGYEYQGDNLFLARLNVLYSYFDYYCTKFNKLPSLDLITEISKIISWNFWQMDGLKFVIPNSCKKEIKQTVLFGKDDPIHFCFGCVHNNIYQHNGIYCYVFDWESNNKIKFIDLIRKEKIT